MKLISIRENTGYVNKAIKYFQKRWATEESMMVYEDCINNSIKSNNSLPQWYLLIDNE